MVKFNELDDQLCASLDLALVLVLATSGPRFNASPTCSQSPSSHAIDACSKLTFLTIEVSNGCRSLWKIPHFMC